jgi:hypothetical protein
MKVTPEIFVSSTCFLIQLRKMLSEIISNTYTTVNRSVKLANRQEAPDQGKKWCLLGLDCISDNVLGAFHVPPLHQQGCRVDILYSFYK